jgi:hypothetical protein
VVELKAETVAAFTHSTVIFTCMCINSLCLTWQGAWRGTPATRYVCDASFLRQFLFISACQELSPPNQKSEPSRFVVELAIVVRFHCSMYLFGNADYVPQLSHRASSSVTDVPCK